MHRAFASPTTNTEPFGPGAIPLGINGQAGDPAIVAKPPVPYAGSGVASARRCSSTIPAGERAAATNVPSDWRTIPTGTPNPAKLVNEILPGPPTSAPAPSIRGMANSVDWLPDEPVKPDPHSATALDTSEPAASPPI